MISGVGIDIVEVATVGESVTEYGNDYLRRTFTPREIEYCGTAPISLQRYAGRVAAKEAAMKALSTGWGQGVEWLDFEILDEPSGQPTIQAYGAAAELIRQRRISKLWVTISHIPEYAIAQVILEQ
jgi:holo-[acyl-carrier protein] synthase